MCLYSKIIKNKKYVPNKKNGGIIPEIIDKRMLYVPASCGKCIECMRKKARDWQIRLSEDIRVNKNAQFITLTFAPSELNLLINEILIEDSTLTGYNLDNQIAKLAVKRFRERWRKKTTKSIRHFLITEIGGKNTEGLHLHGLLWTNENLDFIKDRWQYGHVWQGKYVNEKTINYITKYITKVDFKHKEYTPIILPSPGLGKNYIGTLNNSENRYTEEKKNNKPSRETRETYITRQGKHLQLPMYYRNYTYSEEEKAKLWIKKLNQNIRYVLGKKIDISQGEENYYKILELAQEKNKRLGYGDNQINWSQKRYENERRALKVQEKIIKKNMKEMIKNKKTLEEIEKNKQTKVITNFKNAKK